MKMGWATVCGKYVRRLYVIVPAAFIFAPALAVLIMLAELDVI
jgi:hypothetical protein